MFGATHALKHAGVPAREVESILRPLMTRPAQACEIANTVAKVYSMAMEPHGEKCHDARVNAAKMGEIQLRYKDVILRTWEKLSDPCDDQEEILRWAFKPSEFIACVGRTESGNSAHHFARRDQARKHASVHRPEPIQFPMGLHEGGEALAEERDANP